MSRAALHSSLPRRPSRTSQAEPERYRWLRAGLPGFTVARAPSRTPTDETIFSELELPHAGGIRRRISVTLDRRAVCIRIVHPDGSTGATFAFGRRSLPELRAAIADSRRSGSVPREVATIAQGAARVLLTCSFGVVGWHRRTPDGRESKVTLLRGEELAAFSRACAALDRGTRGAP